MSIFDDLMESDLSDKETGVSVRKDNYHVLVGLRNVHSYSQEMQLQACPRRYQIMVHEAAAKTELEQAFGSEEETSVTFAFGHSVGAGVAEFDRSRDLKSAIFQAFLAWDTDLLAVQEKQERRTDPRKSFAHAVWAVTTYQTFFQEETDLAEYEVVQVEANVGVDFEDGYFYTAHIDELLKSTITGNLKIKENKTTVYTSIDPAMYQNSDQGLGYAVVADAMGATEYSVLYTIYSSTEERWIGMEFTKGKLAKAEWIQGQLLTNTEVKEYEALNFFPKRGRSCIEFGRRCKYFDSCGYDLVRIFGKRFSEIEAASSLEDIEAKTGDPFDYKFKLTQLLKSQRTGQKVINIEPIQEVGEL